MNNIYDTTINFGGFYNTTHDNQVEKAVAMELGASENVDDENEAMSNFDDWKTPQKAYCKEWITLFNDEFGTTIVFKDIDSPRAYNFRTDTISANVSDKDIKVLISFIKENDLKDELFEAIEQSTTSRDGYVAYYTKREFFLKENRHFLIETIIDVCLEYTFYDTPLFVEEFYI